MSSTDALETPTGSSVGLGEIVEDPTRTIADLVDRTGYLKNQTRILVADSNDVHQSTEELHNESLSVPRRCSVCCSGSPRGTVPMIPVATCVAQ